MGNYQIDVLKDSQGNIIRPATITDNVVNPRTRKSVTEEFAELDTKFPRVNNESESNPYDLDIADNNGNVLLRLEGGNIKTKNFNSIKSSKIENESHGGNIADLHIADNNGNVIVRFANGNIETKNFNSASLQYAPMIAPNKFISKNANETLKILCFGSSWFMNTWWYLNKIISSANINCELHCYYIGHSRFEEWIQLYKNDLTPFSGSEVSRGATKNISINGSDWTITTYRSGYTAQQYRDDWYNDLTSGDWDIIAFQQGASHAIKWEYWSVYRDLVSIVKRNCNSRTIVAFNSTWTPSKDCTNTTYIEETGTGLSGQIEYQKRNWSNTTRFMRYSGLQDMSPCGALMYMLRHNATTETSDDLASDTIHPNNGLPMYALCGCFYETFIAPLYNIPFSNIEWLPTTSTQKAIVSGSSWTPISSDQKQIIQKMINVALSDRFSFNEI